MRKTAKATLGGATVLALCIAGIAPAWADPNPIGSSAGTGGDIVGTGSDTLQFVDDFVADGDGSTPGYNSFHKTQRIASFDAVNPETQVGGDYIRLRGGGLSPNSNAASSSADFILRPGNSGGGQTALRTYSKIDYARASSALSSGGSPALGQAAFAQDTIQIAVPHSSSATNALASSVLPVVPTVQDLKGIYEQNTSTGAPKIRSVGDLLANHGLAHTATDDATLLTPVLPKDGSGTKDTFLQSIGLEDAAKDTPTNLRTDQVTLNSTGTNAVYGELIRTEEHDPQVFLHTPSGVPASGEGSGTSTLFAPFSGGRAQLIANGYFGYLALTQGISATAYQNSISLLTGTGATTANDAAGIVAGSTALTDPNDTYQLNRSLYHDFRVSDESKTWINTFVGFFSNPANVGLINDAGLLQLESAGPTGDDSSAYPSDQYAFSTSAGVVQNP